MTTAIYNVAYPNPSLHRLYRLCQCSIDSRTNMKDLLSQLGEQYLDDKDLKRATLWKATDLKLKITDVHDESMQKVHDWIHKKGEDARLPTGIPLIDIVALTKEIEEAAEGDVGELRYVKAREGLHQAIKGTLSPSETVKNAAAVKEAVYNSGGPRYGRPSDRFGPPTALFSEPLALLKYDLEHLESFAPDCRILNPTFELVVTATDFFDDESKREAALKPILRGLLGGQSEWQKSIADGAAKPDGVWLESSLVYLIVELKNEPGLEGDPFLQGLAVYGKIITQDKYAKFFKRSNLPVILLAISGNRLVVSTAVFTDTIYADELLSIRLQLGFHASDNVSYVARVFMAINKSMERLRELYKNLLWPSPTADPPGLIEFPKLEFFCKVNQADGAELSVIDEENQRHATYLARMETETETQVVFVKFAAKYNEGAHRLLANQNPPLAPALYFCARVVGDMYMVVMEYMPKSKGQSIGSRSSTDGLPPPAVVLRDVSKGLDLLHERNLVFGDLRETNLLYLAGDGGQVLFVDFGGVGRDGMDKYSACLNPGAGLGVDRGQVMEKVHDRQNLGRLMERLSRRMS
ncbi:hypothetical protein BDM02DRAFT_3212847 [Thelephora ganbajun]|uniref:Uncharacterized protein n=1 Tax=Thelephora ganbajun TaxID=370292 RepID=A0ACB6Z474_THEGA|nr:hypothetical protein BDM02DRAFT_3212847 [Thelephora ganbajun]